MNKTLGAMAAAAALLAGCSSHHHHMHRLGDALHSRPLVTVRQGIISVAPEPIVFSIKEQRGPIVWNAPAGFTFPGNGIEILGQVVDREKRPVPPDVRVLKDPTLSVDPQGKRAFDCRANEKNREEFSCQPVAGVVQRGVYRYVIRLLDKDNKVLDSDPSIFPME